MRLKWKIHWTDSTEDLSRIFSKEKNQWVWRCTDRDCTVWRTERKKKKKWTEKSLGVMYDSTMGTNIHRMGITEGKEKERKKLKNRRNT